MVVLAIDEHDFRVNPRELPRSLEAAKTTADDDDAMAADPWHVGQFGLGWLIETRPRFRRALVRRRPSPTIVTSSPCPVRPACDAARPARRQA